MIRVTYSDASNLQNSEDEHMIYLLDANAIDFNDTAHMHDTEASLNAVSTTVSIL